MAVLANGLNTIINQRVSGVDTPIYPITSTGNVIDPSGNNLDTVISGINHLSVPEYSGNTPDNYTFLRNDNTWQSIPDASTSVKGVVQLSSATDSDSAVLAATPAAVKAVKDALDTFTDTTAPATYLAATLKGANSGLAELDANGKVPSSQLPSFVDDVIDIAAFNDDKTVAYTDSGKTQAITPEAGKVYILTTDNSTYRWSGTVYAPIRGDLVLGETEATAYRGDRGKIAYDHSQAAHARVDATKVEASENNGYIQIDGTDTLVYAHPGSGTNPHGLTGADVLGLLSITAAQDATSKATASADGVMSKEYAAKLDGISSEANKVVVTRVQTTGTEIATVSTDGGAAVSIYAPSIDVATTSAAGLMSADDKEKLDGISSGANRVEVTQIQDGGALIATIEIDGSNSVDIYAPNDVATTNAGGLMSADDKEKLDGISSEANKVVATAEFSTGTKVATITTDDDSSNAVEVYVPAATTSAAGTLSAADKAKLDNCQQIEIVAKNGTPTITDGIVFMVQ